MTNTDPSHWSTAATSNPVRAPTEDDLCEVQFKPRVPFRLIEATGAKAPLRAVLVFLVVTCYPTWLPEHRTQGPVRKRVLWVLAEGSAGFGWVDDADGLCASGRWLDLVRACTALAGTVPSDLASGYLWDTSEFIKDPCFRFFALNSGLRDPPSALQAAVKTVL